MPFSPELGYGGGTNGVRTIVWRARKLIDDWTEAGIPHEQATRMVLALPEHAGTTAVDKITFRSELANLRTELRAELNELRTEVRAELERLRAELRAEFDAKLAALETRLTTKMIGLVVVQLGVFWAITRF